MGVYEKMELKPYYRDETIDVYNCDCLDGLEDMKDNQVLVDLTVTSPPYFNVKEYTVYENYKKYLEFLESTFTKVYSVTKPGRLCCVNISNILIERESRSKESKRIPLSFHFVHLMETIGWEFLEDIIWLKPEGAAKNRNGGFYQHRQPVAYKPNVVNEYIFVFKKPSPFLIDKVVRSYNSLDSLNSKVSDEYERSNVWKINPQTRSKHPAPYPLELTNKIITYYSFVGDTVLDPFFGSGTTALSCKAYNRKCVGFEIHSKYIDMFVDEVKTITSRNLETVVDLDLTDYVGLSKDDVLKKLLKLPKKLLLDVLKKKDDKIKNTLTKPTLAEKIYDTHF